MRNAACMLREVLGLHCSRLKSTQDFVCTAIEFVSTPLTATTKQMTTDGNKRHEMHDLVNGIAPCQDFSSPWSEYVEFREWQTGGKQFDKLII